MATLDTEDKNFYLQAGWAKDTSIQNLIKNSAISNNLLALIAKNTGKDSKKTEEDVEKALQGNTAAVQQQTNATVDLGKVQREIQKSTRDLQKSLYKNVSSLDRLGSTDAKGMFGNFGSTLNGMVYELNEINPALAELAGVAAIAAEAFALIWKRGTELAQATFDMYDSGVAVTNGMDQLLEASNATGLNLQQLGKAFTKNGQVVTAIGIDRTIKLGKAFNELTHGGTDLGMNFEQAQETLLSYSEIMRSTGEIGKRSNSELVAGAVEYGHTLNMLSQATGKRREQIDAEIKQQLKRPDMQILINSLAPDVRAAARKGLEGLNALGDEAPDLQKMMAGMVTRGESGMREANQPFYDALSQSGAGLAEFKAMTQATMKGDLVSQQQHAVALKKVMQDYAVRMRGYVNDSSPMGEAARAAQKFATSAETLEEQARRSPDQIAQAIPADKDAAEINKANQDITKTMLRLNNSLTLLATKTLLPLASAADYVVTSFNKLLDNLGNLIKDSWIGKFFGAQQTTNVNGPTAGPEMTTKEVITGGALAAISTAVLASFINRIFKTMMSMGGAVKSLFSRGGGAALDAMKIEKPLDRMKSSAGDAIGKEGGGAFKGLIDSLRGFGTLLKDTIVGITDTIAQVSGSLATVLTNLGKGLGGAAGGLVGGLLQGIGDALAALGPVAPEIGLGAAAVGGAITLIGAGIAGATWIMGAALPKFAEGMKSVEDLDGDKLEKTGMGMIKIGGGLVAMGVGEVASAWGNIASGIASLFSADPISKLMRFGELSEPLSRAGEAMAKFAESYPKSMAAINGATFNPAAMASLDKLKTVFEGDGFFASIGKWLTGGDDFVTKLVKLGESTSNIPVFADRLTGFANAYTYLVEAMNQPISTQALANLTGLTDLIHREVERSSPGLIGSLFGSSSPASPAPTATTAIQEAGARVAITTPDQKHKDMMEILTKIKQTLDGMSTIEDSQLRALRTGFNQVSGRVY